MNTIKQQTLKRFNEHLYNVELQELQLLVPTALELKQTLKDLNAESILDYETKLNLQSGFVSAKLSAEAYGVSDVLEKLYKLEAKLEDKLKLSDVTASGKIKNNVLDKLKLKHSQFFSEEELQAKKMLEEAIEHYNKIPQQFRNKLIINRANEMQLNPFVRW